MNENPLKILVIEDERRLARAIERCLSRAGYKVGLAFDAASGLEELVSRDYHLAILDICLPDRSGIELLHEFRERSYVTPILIVSARGSARDKVTGLETGADDYLAKPFDTSELLARIQAILRRNGTIRTSILRTRDIIVDVVNRKVRKGDQEIRLTNTEFSLLEFFLRNKNKILTRRRIAEQVWGYKFESGSNIVDVYVSYLRKSLGNGHPSTLIDTVRGEGFILRDNL